MSAAGIRGILGVLPAGNYMSLEIKDANLIGEEVHIKILFIRAESNRQMYNTRQPSIYSYYHEREYIPRYACAYNSLDVHH